MQRKARGVKLDGSLYDCLFEPAFGNTEVVKKNADLSDTLHLFPDYVPRYASQATRLAAAVNEMGGDLKKTCYNIWFFLVNYIAYQPDTPGVEQIRSTNRLWTDKLGDCDCFAFTISCVLYNLKIPHILRVTQYKEKDGFQHIYVVVNDRGKEIIIDACLERFNIEVPFINKTEVKMDLHFLNGIESMTDAKNGGSVDAYDMLNAGYFHNEMGSIKSFFQNTGNKIKNGAQNMRQNIQNTTTVVKKSLHVINRANPTTVALRLGILTGMKTNMFNIAQNLRYAYLSDEQAAQRGLNMKRFSRYKRLREKLEKIFFSAGGKPENLKESILTGRGNQNKEVALSGYGHVLGNVTEQMELKDIIGSEMFYDEKADSLAGLNGGLGVVTAAVVTAASGILATIAAIIKNIGDLKQPGEPGADPAMEKLESEQSETDENQSIAEDETGSNAPDQSAAEVQRTAEAAQMRQSDSSASAATPPDAGAAAPPPAETKTWTQQLKEFYQQNKTPILVTAGVVAAAGVTYLAYRHFSGKTVKTKAAHNLNGPPKKKGHKAKPGSKVLARYKMKPLN